MRKQIYKKIIIIGDSGRGKTSLARELSKKIGIQYYQTDDFFWKIKYSEANPREESLEKIKQVFLKDEWIVEGTTLWLLEHGLEKADIIIFLRFKTLLSQWWCIIRRTIKEKRENPKELFGLMKHVTYKRYGWGYKKGKITLRELIEPYKEKVVELKSFKESDNFVEGFNE